MLYPSFVYVTKSNQLIGSAVEPANTLVAVDSTVRDAFVASGSGLSPDKIPNGDIATGGFAKTAAIVLSFTGTTPITIDFTALAAATGVQVAGATSFATWNHIEFQNVGVASAITIAPGASNPLRNQLGGTSPTMTLQQNDFQHWNSNAGETVDSTHKTLTFTPTAAGTLLIGVAGA